MKKTQFIPGATEAMAEYATALYSKLLTGYDTFQVDDEALDWAIEEITPQEIYDEVTDRLGRAVWGCKPLLESGLIPEETLLQIVARLDAIERWVDKGNEFNMWCEFKTKKPKNGFESGKVKVIRG